MGESEQTLHELVAGLKKSVDNLAIVAAANSADVARTRRGNIINTVTLVALAVFVLVYYFIELPTRRETINDKINNLACSAVQFRPPGFSTTYDRIRQDYDCPPYVPGTAPDVPGRTTVTVPAPSSSRSRPAGGSSTSTKTVSGAAQAPRTATKTMTASAGAAPARTRTVVRQAPAVTHTERTTVTAVPRCVLLRLICP